MELSKQYAAELEKLVGGQQRHGSWYFTLEQIKQLPGIIKSFDQIDDLAISPYHITENSIMEAYWCILSIKVVDEVQDKFDVLLSETGKRSLKGLEHHYIEQWDYTYYEILKGDVKGFVDSVSRYIRYMEKREPLLREEYDEPDQLDQGFYYEIW
ncbi:hypothetical protein L1279_002477 [Planomicrobium sp. HSC-17F08]|nr:hypothetical protein [Planomicrobium sp. HSC-17F08]